MISVGILGTFIGITHNSNIRVHKIADWKYCMLVIPRFLPIVLIGIVSSFIYKSFDWGNYDYYAKIMVKEFGFPFAYNLYVYGFSDFIDRFYTPSNPPD